MLVIPLILSPYLTRTLKETALGTYTYVRTIAYYFVILANLGISKHGQRIISQNSNDEEKLRKAFWSLFSLHAIISVILSLTYCAFILLFVKEFRAIYWIETFYVLSALFDITWLFYGLENFKSVVIKNTVIKVVVCILIFSFVHNPDDLWKYTLFSAAGIFAGQLVMLPQAIHILPPIRFDVSDLRQHIKPLLIFSITLIASTLYTSFDKTLLGLMSTKENVAFYEYSNQIINVPRAVISVIGTVMFPRACRLAADGDSIGQKKYMDYSFYFAALIGIGSMFGLFGIGNLLAVEYYGSAFEICGNVMKALSPLIYIVGIGDVLRTQYMIPNGLDREYTTCIILNAIINLILTVLLIPILGIYGAVIGTFAAELFGLCYQLNTCKHFVSIKEVVNTTLPFVFIGAIMYGVLKAVSCVITQNLVGLIIELLVGIIVFAGLTISYIWKHNEDIKWLIQSKNEDIKREGGNEN